MLKTRDLILSLSKDEPSRAACQSYLAASGTARTVLTHENAMA